MQAKNILDVWLRNIELKPISNQPQNAAFSAPRADAQGKQQVYNVLSEADTCDLQRNFSHYIPTNPVSPLNNSKSGGRLMSSPRFWSRRRDSNPRPLGPEPSALPSALRLDTEGLHVQASPLFVRLRTLTGAGDGRAHFLMRRLRAEALVKFCCKQRTVLFALRKIPSQGSTPVPLDLCPLTDFDWSR